VREREFPANPLGGSLRQAQDATWPPVDIRPGACAKPEAVCITLCLKAKNTLMGRFCFCRKRLFQARTIILTAFLLFHLAFFRRWFSCFSQRLTAPVVLSSVTLQNLTAIVNYLSSSSKCLDVLLKIS